MDGGKHGSDSPAYEEAVLGAAVDQLCRAAVVRRAQAAGASVLRRLLRKLASWWPRGLLLLALLAATWPAWRWAGLALLDPQALAAWCGVPGAPMRPP